MNNQLKSSEPKFNHIGGQAVIEGVMMRGKKMYAMAVRKSNKEIEIVTEDLHPITEKYSFLKLPILRGMVSFVDSLMLGVSITTKSVEIAGLEETDEEPSKFEKFLEDKLGDKLGDIIMFISIIISVGIAMLLFAFLPVWISSFANNYIGTNTWVLGIVEGFVKITVFLAYILLISRSKEIQRVFQYHGAEHKTINCLEHNEDLNVSNVKKHTRLHKRCGTSFLLIVMLISMIVFMFVRTNIVWMRFGFKLLLIPLIAGISYEIIKWAGASDSVIVKLISFPGLCLQRITTQEPDDSQIETAIAAVKEVLKYEQQH